MPEPTSKEKLIQKAINFLKIAMPGGLAAAAIDSASQVAVHHPKEAEQASWAARQALPGGPAMNAIEAPVDLSYVAGLRTGEGMVNEMHANADREKADFDAMTSRSFAPNPVIGTSQPEPKVDESKAIAAIEALKRPRFERR